MDSKNLDPRTARPRQLAWLRAVSLHHLLVILFGFTLALPLTGCGGGGDDATEEDDELADYLGSRIPPHHIRNHGRYPEVQQLRRRLKERQVDEAAKDWLATDDSSSLFKRAIAELDRSF